MQNQTLIIIALVLAGLLIATGAIYFFSAYEEQLEAAEESGSEGESSASLDTGTLVQTAFFATAGAASIGVAGWIVAARKNPARHAFPYMAAAAGSATLIGLYIASRTVTLPIVGSQDDVGTVDILSNILQGAIATIAASAFSISRRLAGELENRMF